MHTGEDIFLLLDTRIEFFYSDILSNIVFIITKMKK